MRNSRSLSVPRRKSGGRIKMTGFLLTIIFACYLLLAVLSQLDGFYHFKSIRIDDFHIDMLSIDIK